jgi:YgiT-type zinc finger domain-containing protein
MNQKKSNVCGRCKKPGLQDVRRTEVRKGIVIENVPATYCRNCGEELYSIDTVKVIERILANPGVHTTMVELPVARIGEDGEPMTGDELYEHLKKSNDGEEG